MDLPFYYESLSMKACEDLLIQKGKNGSFLLRNSESLPGVICLCVLFQRMIYTYRIFQISDGYFKIQTAYGAGELVFKTMRDLIANFEKPNQGIRTRLRFPVQKERPSQRIRRSRMEEVYAEVEDRDYVDVLPSRQDSTSQKSTAESITQRPKKWLPASKATITHWVKEVISLAYILAGKYPLLVLKARSTRSLAASWAEGESNIL
ncbi:SH2 domain-containing protein 1B-like [Microcaecilia unicolor]|uniref:SH2 domain-containing protein 1B-like n=1 Tax=Microcaecilia unicolor TaxID=1415580 RepID=A0A6P7YCX9_9AMPH|nr:SH2 domain-containing protein 1B-like [Microcaecilia unicolor]